MPAAASAPVNRLGPEPVQHRDGRHVQRILQRLGGADLALEMAVEIGRRVIAEMARPVVEHGLADG